MTRLGVVITEAIVIEYGRDEFLARLSHPFWFQSFGAVMGMDWHSSGITTSVLTALKRGLARRPDLGLTVCGGRGAASRRTPDELLAAGDRTGLDGAALARASRLVAKVDSAAVQDGFGLYLHDFVLADDGAWVVVQQGMSGATGTARRYHWRSEGLTSFVDAPHSAIDGPTAGRIINLTDTRAAPARAAQLDLLSELGPDRLAREAASVLKAGTGAAPEPLLPHLVMPAHHDVRRSDLILRRLHGTLAAAADRGPTDFADLLLVPGVGLRTVEALATVAEVIHGTPCRFADPARHSLAHGGKDRHPFPVPTRVLDRTISVLRDAVARARLGEDDRLAAVRRLDTQARALEATATGPSLAAHLARERAASHALGGRSAFGWEPAPAADRQPRSAK